MSTATAGAGPATGAPPAACARSATSVPDELGCTVRKRSAGALTFAPSGKGSATPDVPPIAIEKAISEGSFIVFRVTRNAVASASGFTRSSTRSAASFAYFGSVGYV